MLHFVLAKTWDQPHTVTVMSTIKCSRRVNMSNPVQSNQIQEALEWRYATKRYDPKKKISETLKRKYDSGEIIAIGNLGCIPWNKDKQDIYSENSLITMSISAKNRYANDDKHPLKIYRCVTPWNKGLELGPMTEEEKEKRSRTLKERWKTHEHHSKGVEPWNKGKTGLQEAWNKGKEMEKIECPHCSKMVDKGNAKRWHFDNCKEIKDVSI